MQCDMQAIMMSLQDRLSASTAEAQQAQQRLSSLEQKIHALEVEKTLAASSEQRLTTSISQVAWSQIVYFNFVSLSKGLLLH